MKDKQIIQQATKIEGWLSIEVMDLFIRILKTLPEGSNLLEIGSWKGRSTTLLALSMPKNSKLYSLDPFSGSQEHKHLYGKVDTFQDYQKNLKANNIENLVYPIKSTTKDLIKNPIKQINFLFIDGSHEYTDVLADFKYWFPLVNDHGWIAFHDYKWQGVKKVIWEEVLTRKDISAAKRVEDTIYFQKKKEGNIFSYYYNQLYLLILKQIQNLKRLRRKVRKRGYFL